MNATRKRRGSLGSILRAARPHGHYRALNADWVAGTTLAGTYCGTRGEARADMQVNRFTTSGLTIRRDLARLSRRPIPP